MCVEKGVYGGISLTGSAKAEQLNSEIISGFSGVKPGDFVFFYVKNVGIYGLWKTTTEAFYDNAKIWDESNQLFPYRVCFEPVVREFRKPIALSDILDLRDKGKIWTFDLSAFTVKSHHPITTDEGKELLRLLLRNNPIYIPAEPLDNSYIPSMKEPLPINLKCDRKGCLIYEGYLNAWFMQSFATGRLKEFIGECYDFINYVPMLQTLMVPIYFINLHALN